jgi:hypothetical protein
MNAEERKALIDEVRSASSCSHPIRLRGQMVDLATGEVESRQLRVACKDRRELVCPACSTVYRTDAWILVSAGLIGGKGVDPSVASNEKLFVTLTAPSFGAVHTSTRSGACHPRPSALCPHGRPTSCRRRHEQGDPELGSPLCEDCFDYEGAVLWNAHASRLFGATVLQLRRRLASHSKRQQSGKGSFRLSYLKVAEAQRRGLIHFHLIFRVDGALQPPSAAPAWLDASLLETSLEGVIREVEIPSLDAGVIKWGEQFQIDALISSDESSHVSSYLAKYSVKSTADDLALAYRFRNRAQIERAHLDKHRRRLALTAWDLGARTELAALRLRLHAQSLGFTGQLITKSRGFTTTFTALRQARAAYMAQGNERQVLEDTFAYLGRGYDHPRGTELAELFFEMDKALRVERKARRDAGKRSYE